VDLNFSSNISNFNQSSEYLKRPNLQKMLQNAMDFPLIMICAGAGYGKTRAVYSFLKDLSAHKIWIQLSERDNTATRFWESYTRMVSFGSPEAYERLLQIGFPNTNDKFFQYEKLLGEMIIKTDKCIFVYDDFHLLHNSSVLRFFEKSLLELPNNATVFILSRTMPDINLTGLMMRERVFTIYEDSLRFSEDEIAQYLNQLNLNVTIKDIHDIMIDTKGWAFAINLIGRSLRKDMKYERCVLEAMKLNIYKLIESEIFLTISEPLQRLLVQISLIDHLASELIEMLTDSRELIEEMEQLHAYIRYDAILNAYVIHHLFLSYLIKKHDILSDSEKKETYQKAAQWCEKYSYLADAITYYEKSGDWDSILRIAHSYDAYMPYDIARYVLDILKLVPEEDALKKPLFIVMRLKLQINLALTDEATEMALRYAEYYLAQPESPDKNNALAGIYCALGFLGLFLCTYTNKYDFVECFEKLSYYYDKNPYSILDTMSSQPVSAWALYTGADNTCTPDEYIDAISKSVPHLSRVLNGNFYGYDDLTRGELCLYRRELHDAELHLKQALTKARKHKQHDIQNRSMLYLMQICFIRGDYSSAEKLLQTMKELFDKTGRAARSATVYDVACGVYYLSLHKPTMVPDWLKGDFEQFTHPAFIENYINFIKAKYHYQTEQYSALLAFIEDNIAEQALLLSKIEFKVLYALSLYQLKKRSEAIAALTEAYYIAEPNKIIMPFIQYRKDMRTLTGAALKDAACPIPESWLGNINRKSSALAKKQTHMISEYNLSNNQKEEVTLTKREIRILKELFQGLSRSEIAASQDISTNTVKMFINIIYDKLHASNLVDAIRIATERNIIGDNSCD